MPELPDVEGYRRVLAGAAKGKRIEGIEAPDRTLLRNTTPLALARMVRGQRFREPERHGKWLVAPGGDITLLMHFGMTGRLDWAPRGSERHLHDRVVFVYRRGELRYRDMRKFGGIWVAPDEKHREQVTGPLGPDAEDVSRESLHELLAGRRGGVKAALMDQRLLAGLGNLLTDEILWRARLSPRARASSLTAQRRDAIYDAMRQTLQDSIRAERVPHGRDWLTTVRDVKGARCPRCGTRLLKGTVAGRTTCWCPRCQRAPP